VGCGPLSTRDIQLKSTYQPLLGEVCQDLEVVDLEGGAVAVATADLLRGEGVELGVRGGVVRQRGSALPDFGAGLRRTVGT
jgi:hypothetical protein